VYSYSFSCNYRMAWNQLYVKHYQIQW